MFNFLRRNHKPGFESFFIFESDYEVENPMRVGILEREQPIPVRFKALWYGNTRDFQGFGLVGVV